MATSSFYSTSGTVERTDTAELRRRKKRFGQRVRTLREAKNWTQEDLALNSGLSRSYVSRLELGDIALPRNDKLGRLASALGTSNEDLLEAAGYMSTPLADTSAALPDLAAYLRRKFGLTQPRLISTMQHIIDLALNEQQHDSAALAPASTLDEQGAHEGKTVH